MDNLNNQVNYTYRHPKRQCRQPYRMLISSKGSTGQFFVGRRGVGRLTKKEKRPHCMVLALFVFFHYYFFQFGGFLNVYFKDIHRKELLYWRTCMTLLCSYAILGPILSVIILKSYPNMVRKQNNCSNNQTES